MSDAIIAAARRIFEEFLGRPMDWQRVTIGGDPDEILASADWAMAMRYAEAALRAAVPEGEPVAWQSRARQSMEGEKGPWSEWRDGKAPQPIPFYWEVEERPLYTRPAPRSDMERELAEARAEIERINSLYGFEQRGRLTAEARADALAAGKARLEGALREISSFLGENFARESIGRVVGDIARAALSVASIPAPADEALTFADGIKAATAFIQKRLQDYVDECGSTDPETGAVEFPGNGDETVCEWEEIIEGIAKLTGGRS